MVFSSLPPYLDPSNWHQQQNHHIINGSSGANHLLPPTPPQAAVPAAAPPPPPPPGSVRPGSMSERARVTNIPMPDSSLKCPRCESTNTKFCYFNNYSLSQPRHFCKTCRRYWTRGGALRNVPVGGGCRRNKRTSKSAASKSSPASGDRQTTSTSTSTISTGAASAASLLGLSPQFPPLRFMSPLSQLTDFTSDVGLNFSGMSAPLAEMGFQGGGIEPAWRLQQFPFLEAASSGLYQFHGGEPAPKLSSSLLTQLASVKMDENSDILNPSKPLMAANGQWNSSTNWTELSNFTSSSTRTPL